MMELALQVQGMPLRGILWEESGKEPARGLLVHVHGQGDYAGRYEELAGYLNRENVSLLAIDLPGHGDSPGKRGDISGVDFAHEVLDVAMEKGRELVPNCPVGMSGHSMGGLLVLHYILKKQPAIQYLWLNAPLLRSDLKKHHLILKLLIIIEQKFPTLCIPTGFRSWLVMHGLKKLSLQKEEHKFHAKVSLRWGNGLLQMSNDLQEAAEFPIGEKFSIYYTQGKKDIVCPVEHARMWVARHGGEHIEYKEISGAGHEPFAEEGKEVILKELTEWIAGEIDEKELL